jgi:hypothetical protein
MTVTLETLELTPAELESIREAMRKMAYFNWLNAGCPDGRDLDFWLSAEREWIEHRFVPSRPCDGSRPQAATPAETETRIETPAEPSARKQRRRERATAD